MAVKWDPKVAGPVAPAGLDRIPAADGPAPPPPALDLPDKSRTLPAATGAPRPTPSQKAAERPALSRRADELRRALTGAAPTQAAAAALAFCATYGMRRSRGARQ